MGGVAAVLALVAAVSFALAATLWQRAAMRAGVQPGDARGLVSLLTNAVWLAGLAAQGVGVALQAAALDRGQVAIVQPLLVTSIVWALPLGHLLTEQTVTRRHVVGAAVVVAGLAVFTLVGRPAAGVDDAPTADWITALFVVAVICAALLMFGGRGGAGSKAAVFGATAGALYGVAATLMKPVVESLHTDGVADVLGGWQLWVMCAAGLVGFWFQQVSLAAGKLVASVATVSVVNPVVSVLLGALVLQETLDRTPEWRAVVAVGALAIALLGAVMIAAASETDDDPVQPARPGVSSVPRS